ncbi:MAG: hypothetical protein CBC35_04265 [Planctomycetes bacterium TMED75]|nr:hypothetical protein [Planctomycetaceae bacterium]OUU94189.1 MAG: hypothetical protein CBC35_04265 [Planctomycetes bacterium TMED75]
MSSRRDRAIAKRRIGVNLTPMIDVVFQLLIYFLLATNFALGEQVFRLDLPDRGGSQQTVDPFEVVEEPLRILVESSSSDENGLRIRIDGPYPQPESLEQLERFLTENRAEAGIGYFLEDHPVDIVPNESTHWGHVVDVFNATVRAGYLKVRFSEPEPMTP